MIKYVAIKMDDQTHKLAKLVAYRRGTTLRKLLIEMLERIVKEDQDGSAGTESE
jgi:hypothetical protein|tara:strand:- start:883 stop:1044 length:162 start_codon:yes stop_codon:yes gene_type:complete